MENFKFRLQKLLDIRIRKEEKSILEFKEAQVEKENVAKKLDELEGDYLKHKSFNYNDSVINQKLKLNYLNALDKSIESTSVELTTKDEILENKRSDLNQKQIDRKTVEILKEKQKSSFIKEQNLIEQKSNDEFALYSFIRNRERG